MRTMAFPLLLACVALAAGCASGPAREPLTPRSRRAAFPSYRARDAASEYKPGVRGINYCVRVYFGNVAF